MNKFKKYLMIGFLSACMCVGLSACNGCKNDEEETPGEPTVENVVSLNMEQLTLTVGDTDVLIATFTQADGAELAFASSDESVVTVDGYGRLTAVGVGTATVTATYGDASDTCAVTVSLNGIEPVLAFAGAGDNVKISMDTFVDLSGKVLFNGNAYDDVQMTYTISDESFGRIENGLFYPAKTGTVEVYAVGDWRGVTGETLTKTVTISIVSGVDFYLNEGASALTLYTQAETATPFVVTATADGATLDYTVEVLSGEEYIDLDLTAGTIASTGVIGEALISITCMAGVEEYVMEIPVTVDQTIYRYESLVTDFSAIHGDTQEGKRLTTIMGGIVVEAYDIDGNALNVQNGKVYGVPYSKDGKFQTTITVCTKEFGYEMDIEGYAGIFNSADDLAALNTNAKYLGNSLFGAIDDTMPIQCWDGYYIVTENIDASGYTHKSSGQSLSSVGIQNGAYSVYGLTGTFDGQGHTIKGMSVEQYGLFGYISGGTLQNIAFTDVQLHATWNYTAALAAWIDDATLNDVYVQLRPQSCGGTVVAPIALGINTSTFTNCIFDTSGVKFNEKSTIFGNIAGRYTDVTNFDEKQTKYANVYVISDNYVGYIKTTKNIAETTDEEGNVTAEAYVETTEHFLTAENVPLTPVRPEGKTETDWIMHVHTIEGVKQYVTQADMDAAANAYTSFSAEYWDLSGASPVWKSVNGYYPPADTYVGDFDTSWL